MTALPLDLLSEEELIAEFHKAGIFTDREIEEQERRRNTIYPHQIYFAEQMRLAQGHNYNPLALEQQRLMQNMEPNPSLAGLMGSLGGNILGGIL